jgi:hypothetical protein
LIRTYARVAAGTLLAVAVVGFSILGWRTTAAFYHAGVAILFAYAGFLQRDRETARQIVGGLGILLLAVKAVTTVMPLAWGGPPQHGPIEMTCLVLGLASVLAARYLPGDASRPGP